MANSIKQLMTQLGTNRDNIKAKLVEMGLTVAEAGKLSDVAETVAGINVNTDDTEITLEAGQSHTLTPGNYYKNPVSIVSKAADIANKYFTGKDLTTLTGSVSIPYIIRLTWENSQQIAKVIATEQTLSAPEGYIFKTVTVTGVTAPDSSIKNDYVTAEISDTGKTITFGLNGSTSYQQNNTSGTAVVTYSYERTSELDNANGTPVIPTTEEQDVYADPGKVMTAFTVAAIPIENGTVSEVGNIIATKEEAEADATYELNAASGKYMQSVSIKKVVIDSKTVTAEELYNNTEEDLVINASELGYDGISSITIPRPAVADGATSQSQVVDLLSETDEQLEFEVDETTGLVNVDDDYVASIPAGYYSAATTVTIHTAELYNALAAI